MGERRIRMLISGRVQGVCFRAYTCEEAQRLGLKGRVRNLVDGCVEVLAEGTHEKLNVLEALCRKGPPFAHVRDVQVHEENMQSGDLPPFRITY